MKNIKIIQANKQINILSDPRRMKILRLLMDDSATLSQLGSMLGQSPAWVRHHIQKLESANLIELYETRKTGKVTEKYYRAKAGGFLLQELILPQSDKQTILFSGSHDLAIELAAKKISRYAHLLSMPVGSLDGLINLRQGLCQVSGSHLVDENGQYNLPYTSRIFPDREMELVTLAHRTQGLIIAKDNPHGIHSIRDLARGGLRFINRNPGSGTRLWLDAELDRLGIPNDQITGYSQWVPTHTDSAHAVQAGKADAALGLQASAQKSGLGFIPIFNERYDLVFPQSFRSQLVILLDYIQSGEFRRILSSLGGYDTKQTGAKVTSF